ncbi:hypothetical protein CYFUS_001553 [Cystobacter fuscus]|uniref:Lipoprotein n=1 Tax=Cystobacter fuscus TaxID=43 RepID=A0A250IWN0_9BACT|nr:hypothetical protein [Cystobacter fuscus]ATB36139.1 hypothetical protein CYFUS_001553 [Cystobacter fuscus]
MSTSLATLLISTFVASACGAPEQMENVPTPFKERQENVASFTPLTSGVYDARVDGAEPVLIAPGEAREFSFSADEGQKLEFAATLALGKYNGYRLITPPGGIDLYESNTPISGDITSSILLRYVGTEEDKAPTIGSRTSPKQTGASFAAPEVSSILSATVHSNLATSMFTVRIENVSQDVTLHLEFNALSIPMLWGPDQE